MTHFSAKLGELSETLRLVRDEDLEQVGEAIAQSAHKPALAVGSGGSAIAATYFQRCRETLFGVTTETTTPMGLVVGATDLSDTEVWLFSAGFNNPDIRAALQAARSRGARQVQIVTRRPDVVEALALKNFPNVSAHVTPVADQKDGFLATHSLVSAIAVLLLASNHVSTDSVAGLVEAFEVAALAELHEDSRRRTSELFSDLKPGDTLLIIADPQIAPVASLIETSAWEAAICPVQMTDFRNFAHGRHSWLHHYPSRTVVLALTGHDTVELWERLSILLPRQVRQISIDFGNCGRFSNAIGILRGFACIEGMGRAAGIDPGKPGIGDFGRTFFEDESLEQIAEGLGPSVRQKRGAILGRDDPVYGGTTIHVADRERLARLKAAPIGGIVLDYDGTIVPTDRRNALPSENVVNQLRRLYDLGVKLAIATGRGGSAGEKLREVLPVEMHRHVTVGYYNGAYIRSLDVDIRVESPPIEPAIAHTADWLASKRDLFLQPMTADNSRVQITLQLANIRSLERFYIEIAACESVASGAVGVTRSGHSVDIILAGTSKRSVADRLAEDLQPGLEVLRIGDQGSRTGNDYELLAHSYGVSVDEVCGRHDGCWSLFGTDATGPAALLRLLESLQRDRSGKVCIDLRALGLDDSPKTGTK